jgi:hypothetical protein
LCRAADDDAGFAFVADMAVDAWPGQCGHRQRGEKEKRVASHGYGFPV